MIPPTGKKRYHIKPSFFSFFGDLPSNNRGELTKNENLHQITSGIKITLEVVSLYSVVKNNCIIKNQLATTCHNLPRFSLFILPATTCHFFHLLHYSYWLQYS